MLLISKSLTAQQVIDHAKSRRRRGKNPSLAFRGIKNPRLALQKAIEEVTATERQRILWELEEEFGFEQGKFKVQAYFDIDQTLATDALVERAKRAGIKLKYVVGAIPTGVHGSVRELYETNGRAITLGDEEVKWIKDNTVFITERICDDAGNLGHGQPRVLQARKRDENTYEVIRPFEFAKKWPTVRTAFFFEVEGPAREISGHELYDLVMKACADGERMALYELTGAEAVRDSVNKNNRRGLAPYSTTRNNSNVNP